MGHLATGTVCERYPRLQHGRPTSPQPCRGAHVCGIELLSFDRRALWSDLDCIFLFWLSSGGRMGACRHARQEPKRGGKAVSAQARSRTTIQEWHSLTSVRISHNRLGRNCHESGFCSASFRCKGMRTRLFGMKPCLSLLLLPGCLSFFSPTHCAWIASRRPFDTKAETHSHNCFIARD